jgi:hypothetical protein
LGVELSSQFAAACTVELHGPTAYGEDPKARRSEERNEADSEPNLAGRLPLAGVTKGAQNQKHKHSQSQWCLCF